jgi:hypothetical protein
MLKARTAIKKVLTPDTTIRIGTLNLENWGNTKSERFLPKLVVPDLLRQMGILAFQEVGGENSLDDLLRRSNWMRLDKYDLSVSNLTGNGGFAEKFAFAWDTGSAEFRGARLYTQSRFMRDPYIAKFLVGDLEVVISTLHTSPDHVVRELTYIPALMRYCDSMRGFGGKHRMVIIAGDLNAGTRYIEDFRERTLPWLSDSRYAVVPPDDADTTATGNRQWNALDRIVFSQLNMNMFSGYGIIKPPKFLRRFTEPLAAKVSDHYLVYADFNIFYPERGK